MRMPRFFRLLGLALLAAGAASPLRAQQEPPAPGPMTPVPFPAFHERTLTNGAQVIVVENHEQPVVSVSLRIRSGSVADPAGKPGVASFTASLLDKGTATRSAREIAESIDFVGGSLGAGAGADFSSLNSTVLTEFLDTALVLMSDVARNPTFPAEELETERTRTLSSLQVELSQPDALASRRFLAEVYGDHPYGALPTPESVRAIAREDLEAFHRAHYRPDNALFVVAGDVDPDDVARRLDHHFGDWAPGASPRPSLPAPPERDHREIVFIHKPGSVQAAIRVGHLMPPAGHPDWTVFSVGNQVLGGGTTGWLFRVLRDEKGYTYGAYANATRRIEPGYFQAAAEVRNEVADSALDELFRLMEDARGRIPAEDLRTAKDYMTGSFPLTIETPQQVAGQVASTRLLGLPHDHLARYRERIAAVTADDVRRVMGELLRPDRAIVVVVGDATRIHDRIARFGPVRMVDVNGRPLRMEDLEVRAAEVSLDAAAIPAQTLGYAVTFQGNPIAEITNVVTREMVDGRDAIKVATRGTGMLTVEQETAFDAMSFEAIYSRGSQQAGPQTTGSDLRFLNGRVVGTVLAPDGQTRPVDVEAPAGTLLPGMDDPALWVIDYAPGRELSLPSFDAQTGAVVPMTIRVVGEDRITVPAGEFDVFELQVSSGEASLRTWVRNAAPHIIVRQEFAGQPITIELKSIQ